MRNSNIHSVTAPKVKARGTHIEYRVDQKHQRSPLLLFKLHFLPKVSAHVIRGHVCQDKMNPAFLQLVCDSNLDLWLSSVAPYSCREISHLCVAYFHRSEQSTVSVSSDSVNSG